MSTGWEATKRLVPLVGIALALAQALSCAFGPVAVWLALPAFLVAGGLWNHAWPMPSRTKTLPRIARRREFP